MVEGAALEMLFRGNSNEGSNPSLSVPIQSILSAISGQHSAVSRQPSAVSGQPSAELTEIKPILTWSAES